MESRIDMSQNEILEALRNAIATQEHNDNGVTTAELAEVTGRSQSWCAEKLRPLVKNGTVKCVRKRTTDMADRTTLVPAYIPA